MVLQRAVDFEEYFRCYVVGQDRVHIMAYDPRRPFHERYVRNPPAYAPGLLARVEKDSQTLCRALGYDLNTVEFAVEDGVPYAIDFMNPAPDCDRFSVGDDNFEWVLSNAAEMLLDYARHPAALELSGDWPSRLRLGAVAEGVAIPASQPGSWP